MPSFSRGDLVRVPFPYTNRDTQQRRPALVIASDGEGSFFLWVLMVTSATHRRWPGDIDLTEDAEITGLPVPSIVRTAKVATIEAEAAEKIGTISKETLATVQSALRTKLGLS